MVGFDACFLKIERFKAYTLQILPELLNLGNLSRPPVNDAAADCLCVMLHRHVKVRVKKFHTTCACAETVSCNMNMHVLA